MKIWSLPGSASERGLNKIGCIPAGKVSIALVLVLALFTVSACSALVPASAPAPEPASPPPAALVTAQDYLAQGDYDFDRHDYDRAIADYSAAIALNPNYAEAYNNRAYTYMTKQAYALALPDLNKAIELRPTYVNALMNRGDIYNYYYQIDYTRAISDYNRVLALGRDASHRTSVCGHLWLAKHKGWNLGTVLDYPHAVACD